MSETKETALPRVIMHDDQSENVDQILKALFDIQTEMPLLERTSENKFHKSRYADLAEYWKTVKPILNKYDVLMLQQTDSLNGNETEELDYVRVRTVLYHVTSGQWVANSINVPYKKGDPKSAGSAETYGRRYSAEPLTMTVQEGMDDDGNRANGDRTQTRSAPPPRSGPPSSSGGQNGGQNRRPMPERDKDARAAHARRADKIFNAVADKVGDEAARTQLTALVREITGGGVSVWSSKSFWFIQDEEMSQIEARAVESNEPKAEHGDGENMGYEDAPW